MTASRGFRIDNKGHLTELFGGGGMVSSVITQSGHTYYLRGASVRPVDSPVFIADALIYRDDGVRPSLQAHVFNGSAGMHTREGALQSIITSPLHAVRMTSGEKLYVTESCKVGMAPWDIAIVCTPKPSGS